LTEFPLVPKLHLGTGLSAKLCFLIVAHMRSRYRAHESHATYFVTATIVAWLPVFTTAARCDILIEALEYCRVHKDLKIYAWVILDNHFHAILTAPNLPRVLADFKRHTAQRILDQLEKEGCDWLLNQFKYFRAKHKAESRHQVWQEGSHPQEIDSDEMMLQKLDYIHDNPVKRGSVTGPEHWRYSSAHEWLTGASPMLRCDQWQ
jgi:putative transposase